MPYRVKEYTKSEEMALVDSSKVLLREKTVEIKCHGIETNETRELGIVQTYLRRGLKVSRASNRTLKQSRHTVIVEQYLTTEDHYFIKHVYKVFYSTNKDEAEEAYTLLEACLKTASSIPFSNDLLKAILLPKPKLSLNLAIALLRFISVNEKLSPIEWAAFVNIHINERSLAFYACEFSEIHAFELLIKHGTNPLAEDPVNGNTLLHIAVKWSSGCLKMILEWMHESLPHHVLSDYLSRPNRDMTASLELRHFVREHSQKSSAKQYTLVSLSAVPFGRLSPTLECRSPIEGGVTPLMLACKRGNLRSCFYLLVEGADPNVKDLGSGVTPLHIATCMGNVPLVQLLLAFDADIQACNRDGITPLSIVNHRRKEVERCFEVVDKTNRLKIANTSKTTATMHETKATSQRSVQDGIILLSLDGGGTRGIISAFILLSIEKKMKVLSQNPQLDISHYFNWFSTSSIGTIISIIMAYGECSVADVIKLIVFYKDDIFHGRRIYSPVPLITLAKKYVSEKLIENVTNPKVLVTVTQADISPPQLILVTNYRKDPENERQWKAWEAIRASTAAPTYFPSFEGKYVDGAVLAVNPVLYAMSDIHHYDKRKLKFVLSLGTGMLPTQPIDSIDIALPRLSTNLIADLKTNFKFLSGLLNILTANLSNIEGPSMQAQDWCEAIGARYHRFSPPISKYLFLDTTDDIDIVSMLYDTYIYCLERDKELEDIAQFLVEQGPQRD